MSGRVIIGQNPANDYRTSTQGPAYALGTIGTVINLGSATTAASTKTYKYLQYKQGAAAVDGVAGEVAAYYTLDGYKLNQATSDYSDTQNLAAGVLQTDMEADSYGWFQIKGAVTLSINPTAGSDGSFMTTVGAGDGTLDVVDTTSAATAMVNVCAQAGDISDNEYVLFCVE